MWWCAGHAHAEVGGVIPVPLSMQQERGSFTIAPSTRLYTNLQGRERELMAAYIATLPQPLGKKFHRGLPSSPDNAIVLLKTSDAPSSPEGYTLDITPRSITIRSAGDTGLFYGLQTLLQLVTATGDGSLKAAATGIEDAPRLEYRGVMIDVSRHFRSKEFLKKQIDALARYKLNRLHLHLTDAAGWRIELPGYPLLTEFAAWRPEANWKKWWNAPGGRRYCEQSDPRSYGG
ncbi:MAG: family 20 glycosylhydrolase, partial [Duncaniella sp.]|nr:family 20 glycosylhydrolase [Duncaniella sp.]